MKDFPYTKLIIIDTWAYIRSKDNGMTTFGRYQEDVEDLNKLKKFCSKHNLSIMVSTHTGKAKHDDWTRNVHGGVGQTATADSEKTFCINRAIIILCKLSTYWKNCQQYPKMKFL